MPELFNKPSQYAKFLGRELSPMFVGPLLIVMPAGFGIYDGGRSVAAEQAVLGSLEVSGKSADTLTGTAATAVQKLTPAGALRSKEIRPPQVYTQLPAGSAAPLCASSTPYSTTASERAKSSASPPVRHRRRPCELRFDPRSSGVRML